jgi:hypothetical protein
VLVGWVCPGAARLIGACDRCGIVALISLSVRGPIAMTSHHRHARRAHRRWCAGLAAVAVVAASLASAGTASAAAPAAAASAADCTGTAAAEPLVPFDTIAYPYNAAIAGAQVGPMFCPDPDSQAVQVVVLNSKTLGLVSNRGYSTSQFAALGSDLQNLSTSAPSSLVIVTHPGNQPALPSGSLAQLDTSLGAIGGTVAAQWSFPQKSTAAGCSSLSTGNCEYGDTTWQRGTLSGSSFTVIGIPKMPAGQAWRETAAQNGTPDGRITGYLELGTVLSCNGCSGAGVTRYTVVNGPDPYVPVDTCTADGCAVQVGDQTYQATPGASGLHVVELDRTTLTPLANTTVTTTAQLNSILTNWPVPPVADYITNWNYPVTNPPSFPQLVNDQRVVIIQSVGTGKLSGTLSNATLQAIDQVGGTVDYLAAAVTQGCRYALVGAATDLPWHATTSAESSTAMVQPGDPCSDPDQAKPDQPTGHVSGVVQRDRDGLYTPSAASAVGPTNVLLYQILNQPATAWPYAGDTTDLRYIADNIGLCAQAPPAKCNLDGPDNSDVRSAYPDTQYAKSWNDFRENLYHLTCPPTFPQTGTCDPGNFGNVKDELYNDEFPWVNKVYGLTDELRAPYEQAGTTLPFDVKDVTNQVLGSIPNVPDHSTTMQWLKIFTDVMTIASKAAGPLSPAASAVFGVLGAASTLATDLMQTSGGGPADSVTEAADDLGGQLEKQQIAYLEWVNNAQDILMSDYGRLKAVGTNSSWAWPPTYTNYLIEALEGSTRASAYSALMPLVWGGYNLTATTFTSTGPLPNPANPDDVTKYGCSEYYELVTEGNTYEGVNTTHPFKSALELNQFHSVSGFNGSTGAALKEVWTFAKDVSGFADNQYPAATVLGSSDLASDIYGATSTDAGVGAYQYEASWWRSTYNPPSHVTCAQLTAPNSGLAKPYSRVFPPPAATPSVPPT